MMKTKQIGSFGKFHYSSSLYASFFAAILVVPATSFAWISISPAIHATFITRSSSSCKSFSTALGMTAMRRRPKQQQSSQRDNNNNNDDNDDNGDSDEQQQQQQQSSSSFNNILEDGHGGVNAALASVIWDWEQQHRENEKLPKLNFSTRQGLRLVDEIVKSISESSQGQKLLRRGNDDTVCSDLIQEGVMALMDAINEYRQLTITSSNDSDSDDDDNLTLADHNKKFEEYARPYLEERLWSTLDNTSRPVQLPETESHVWNHIQKLRPELQKQFGRDPTTKELAQRLELPVQTVQSLLAAKRGTLSMESTVEIKNPDSLEDQTTHFANQEEWQEKEGHFLDTGKRIIKDELVDEYQDEMYQHEGEDEMWIHQEQTAGPLRDLIPDKDPSRDDIALIEMLRHDVGEFLTKSLSPKEVQVVQLSFGLGGMGEPMKWSDIGQEMGLKEHEVKELLKEALCKLQTTYKNNYVESQYYEDDDFYGEDSV